MAKPEKLSRADVYKQIDAFRGRYKQKPSEKSVRQELLKGCRAERDRENHRAGKSKSTG
jgi:tRNA U55 pseudouridine synthase TruB